MASIRWRMEEIEEEMGPTVWANSRVKEGDLGKGEVREKLGIKFRRVLEIWSSGQRRGHRRTVGAASFLIRLTLTVVFIRGGLERSERFSGLEREREREWEFV